MESDQTEALIQTIGDILHSDLSYPGRPTLLVAKVGRMVVGASVFKDAGAEIVYVEEILDELTDPLLHLWEAQDGEPWAELEYILRDGEFTVHYTYPDEIDEEEDPFDRRDRAVAKYLGNKPIVYPPPPDDEDEETFTV